MEDSKVEQQFDKSGKQIKEPPYEINMLKESYFKDKTVQKFLEYSPNLYAVCL